MPRLQREIPWTEQRNGWWYVFWYDAERRRTERLSLGTRETSEAQDRYIAFLSEGRSLLRRPANAGVTVREVLDSYLREHVGVDPDTGEPIPGVTGVADKARQLIAARHLRGFWADTPVSSIDIQESRRYRDTRALAEKPAGPTTVRRELNLLVAAVNHAVRWKRLKPDAVPVVELPPHAPPVDTKFLTKAELKKVFEEAGKDPDPRIKAFAVLAYVTGARRKSIERIRKAQIDLERRRMALTPPGKARTKKRAPIVPIGDEMAAEIRKLWLWSGASELLFRDPGFDVYHKYAEACVRAGVGDRPGPHILRHSRATHMLQDGAAIWDVAKLLGDTVETVERVYGHHCPDYMAGRTAFTDLGGVLG